MKHFSILLLSMYMLSYSSLQAQSFAEQIETIFEQVDLDQVPSGILADAGLQFHNPAHYDGNIQADREVSLPLWRFLYTGMYSSQVNEQSNLPSPVQINQSIKALANTPAIELIALHLPYHQLKAHTLSANLMYRVGNQLYDTPNRSESPYEAQTLFAFCPVQSVFETGTLQFIFPAQVWVPA